MEISFNISINPVLGAVASLGNKIPVPIIGYNEVLNGYRNVSKVFDKRLLYNQLAVDQTSPQNFAQTKGSPLEDITISASLPDSTTPSQVYTCNVFGVERSFYSVNSYLSTRSFILNKITAYVRTGHENSQGIRQLFGKLYIGEASFSDFSSSDVVDLAALITPNTVFTGSDTVNYSNNIGGQSVTVELGKVFKPLDYLFIDTYEPYLMSDAVPSPFEVTTMIVTLDISI